MQGSAKGRHMWARVELLVRRQKDARLQVQSHNAATERLLSRNEDDLSLFLEEVKEVFGVQGAAPSGAAHHDAPVHLQPAVAADARQPIGAHPDVEKVVESMDVDDVPATTAMEAQPAKDSTEGDITVELSGAATRQYSDRTCYQSAIAGPRKVAFVLGDALCFTDDEGKEAFGLVQSIWEDAGGVSMQLRLMLRSTETSLGSATTSNELFIAANLVTRPIDSVRSRILITQVKPSASLAAIAEAVAKLERTAAATVATPPTVYFYRSFYRPKPPKVSKLPDNLNPGNTPEDEDRIDRNQGATPIPAEAAAEESRGSEGEVQQVISNLPERASPGRQSSTSRAEAPSATPIQETEEGSRDGEEGNMGSEVWASTLGAEQHQPAEELHQRVEEAQQPAREEAQQPTGTQRQQLEEHLALPEADEGAGFHGGASMAEGFLWAGAQGEGAFANSPYSPNPFLAPKLPMTPLDLVDPALDDGFKTGGMVGNKKEGQPFVGWLEASNKTPPSPPAKAVPMNLQVPGGVSFDYRGPGRGAVPPKAAAKNRDYGSDTDSGNQGQGFLASPVWVPGIPNSRLPLAQGVAQMLAAPTSRWIIRRIAPPPERDAAQMAANSALRDALARQLPLDLGVDASTFKLKRAGRPEWWPLDRWDPKHNEWNLKIGDIVKVFDAMRDHYGVE